MTISLLQTEDVDEPVTLPDGLMKVVEHNLIDITPWHIMPRELAVVRLKGLRQRYQQKYVPFAYRQDNDDVATILTGVPDRVVVIHDFAADGSEVVCEHESFWAWFRAAVDDLIEFE
jgi:hypothetical protein